jgi:hypothetical protein
MTCCGSKFNCPGIRLLTARVKGHRRHRPRAARLAPEVIIPAHCTSWKAAHTTVRHLPGAFIKNSVGTTFHLTRPMSRMDRGQTRPALRTLRRDTLRP